MKTCTSHFDNIETITFSSLPQKHVSFMYDNVLNLSEFGCICSIVYDDVQQQVD